MHLPKTNFQDYATCNSLFRYRTDMFLFQYVPHFEYSLRVAPLYTDSSAGKFYSLPSERAFDGASQSPCNWMQADLSWSRTPWWYIYSGMKIQVANCEIIGILIGRWDAWVSQSFIFVSENMPNKEWLYSLFLLLDIIELSGVTTLFVSRDKHQNFMTLRCPICITVRP